VAGDRGDGDRRRDADEDQQRRHQEAAADPEHAGDEPNRRAHRQDEETLTGMSAYREVELHARLLFVVLPKSAAEARSGIVFSLSIAQWKSGAPAPRFPQAREARYRVFA